MSARAPTTGEGGVLRGEFEHNGDGASTGGRLSPDLLDQLVTRARSAALTGSLDGVVSDIEELLGTASHPVDRGELHLARALAHQTGADLDYPAADARAAVPLLRVRGYEGRAAFAAACAAGLTFRTGDLSATIDLAVEALTLLNAAEDQGQEAFQATNAMAVLLSEWSAFRLALTYASRAVEASQEHDPATTTIANYTLAFCAIEGSYAPAPTDDDTDLLALAEQAGYWLRDESGLDVPARLVGPAVLGDVALSREDAADHVAPLDAGVEHRHGVPIRMANYHRLVRGGVHARHGDPETAIADLDLAAEWLKLASDHHRLLRCLTYRSEAKERLGDIAGALADAREGANLARLSEFRHVGLLSAEITRRAELEQSRRALTRRADELARVADEDPVTGVGTRRWLNARMADLAKLDGKGAVLAIDLDRFKRVNDTHGHHVGDEVLRRVGDTLRRVVRRGDVVGRYGGEEFVAVLLDEDAAGGHQAAERLRAELAAVEWSTVAEGLGVTTSVGVAAGPLSEVHGLLRRADSALYQAKREGRDRVVTL